MLIEFSVENFRSFKERMTLSMEANNSPDLLHSNTVQVNKKLRLVKSAAIYGANASGKSNLVKAINFMRNYLLAASTEIQEGIKLPYEPFLLNTSEWNKPSLFELIFLIDNTRYRYGFQLTEKMIIAEWLFAQEKNIEKKLFTRENNIFSISLQFKEAKGLEKRTRENALFLSVLAQFNVSLARNIMSHVGKISAFGDILLDKITENVSLSSHLKLENASHQINTFLNNFHLGFSEIFLRNSTLKEVLPTTSYQPLEEFINDFLFKPGRNDTLPLVLARHNVLDDRNLGVKTINFNLRNQESDGTQKIVAFAYRFILTLQFGFCIFFDEIDASLHPLLTRKIIELFNDSETNPNGAQLIFTTHDTNLLSNKLLRRDQIWFTEKTPEGATDLYSLADFEIDSKKASNNTAYSQDYILGKYGAIPYIGDIHSLSGKLSNE